MVSLNGTEQALPLAESRKLFPGRPHVGTVRRWATKGVRGVRLETMFVGGRLFVTPDAAERFIIATTAARNGSTPKPQVDEAAVRRAEAVLDAAGI